MKKTILFLCFSMMLLQWVQAQMLSGENVMIREGVDHDLYVVGRTVTIDAPIKGDLMVAGGTIVVNDTVTQDILMAGGDIYLNGVVSDDIRCVGGTVELNGIVAGDFVVTGARVRIGKKAAILGDLICSGSEVTLEGDVKGNVRDASGIFTLNGAVGQELHLKGARVVINGQVHGKTVMAAEVIELGPDAKFDQDVGYWNKAGSLDFKNSMLGGKATYDPGLEIEHGKWHYLGFASLIVALWYLGTALVMIWLIQYLFSTTFKNAANTIRNDSLKSLGFGILFLIGVPVAVVICFVTIIGVPLGILGMMSYVTLILLATVIVALMISNWINNTYYRSWGNGRIVFSALGIFIFLKLASFTPFVGPLVMLLLACMAFGGLLLNVRWKRNKKELAPT